MGETDTAARAISGQNTKRYKSIDISPLAIEPCAGEPQAFFLGHTVSDVIGELRTTSPLLAGKDSFGSRAARA